MAARILILGGPQDLHAHAVGSELTRLGAECSIIEAAGFPQTGKVTSWSSFCDDATVRDVDARIVDISTFDVIWWRRLRGGPPPEIAEHLSPAQRDLILNDTRAAIVGLFLTRFAGKWVSHPEASRRAENKLVQLQAAAEVGLRVPKTIVTQDADVATAFCRELDYAVVVKPVAGTSLAPLLAGRATPELLAERSRVEQSPVILQALVPGRRHLRVCCFGDRCHAVLLETDHLDWRHPLDAEMRPTVIDEELARGLSSVVAALGLRMGIFDLKLTDSGETAFLEVNPQGQFLFLDGLCGTNLLGELAAFLLDEAAR